MNNSIVLPSTYPVTCHTDFVEKDSIFVAIEGFAENGVNYIIKALEKGACMIVVQHDAQLPMDVTDAIQKYGAALRKTANTRKMLAQLSAAYAWFPAKALKIIGVTGTKGKTTTSFLLEHILRVAGHKTALLSSAQNKILDTCFPASLTTPQPDYLHQFFGLCIENEVEYVVMEVAAQALSLHRVEGITFDGVIFTNFSHEHLEFYSNLSDYFKAKSLIFKAVKKDHPVIVNADNTQGKIILKKVQKSIGYSFKDDAAQHYYKGLYNSDVTDLVSFAIQKGSLAAKIGCKGLFGLHNAYNVLAATSMALELGISQEAIILKALASFSGVPGRLEHYVLPNKAQCFIDYAHNPDSFNAILSTLRTRTNHLIVVFGAGGGRDKQKRPIMGGIAAQYADTVIITSDNPRLEDANQIADEIGAGVSAESTGKIVRQLDRKKAIEHAYALSSPGSIIALLGKGPDEYQLVGSQKSYFSEKEIIKSL